MVRGREMVRNLSEKGGEIRLNNPFQKKEISIDDEVTPILGMAKTLKSFKPIQGKEMMV